MISAHKHLNKKKRTNLCDNPIFHFLSSHPVELICIQEINLISFFFFQIPEFSAQLSDRTHSLSGILSPDAMHASGILIFIRQGLSFSELSTSSLSSLDSYSDYVGVNISLNSSLLSFLNVHAPPIFLSPMDGRTDSFSPSILPSSRNLFILGDLLPLLGLKRYFRPPQGGSIPLGHLL